MMQVFNFSEIIVLGNYLFQSQLMKLEGYTGVSRQYGI